MKGLVYKSPGIIELEDVSMPIPERDELLLNIKAVGICGSDIEGYLGKTGRRTPPMIMGHELAAIVEEVNNCNDFKKGDRVTVYPKLYCGNCKYCKEGLTNICTNASFLGALDKNGGMAEYLAINKKYVVKINKINFREACMVEPLSVAYGAVSKINKDKLNNANNILVIGAGTIGLLILQLLKLRGARNVIVSDLYDYRLEKAKECGADYVINPQEEDILSKIKLLTNGNLIDVSIEAVGFSKSVYQSIELLKTQGTGIWVGNAQKIVEVNMQKIVTKEIKIIGSYFSTTKDFHSCLKIVGEGKINFDPIISCEENLKDGKNMFNSLANICDGKLIKVILIN